MDETLTMPKVTVLMPVYNGENYLREAMDSILNQTFTDFEFVIVNDGSIDKSLEIINSYHDSRIKLIENPKNLGISESLNKGLFSATGKYIVRMDCDDISLPHRLQKQIEYLDNHPEVIIVGSYIDMIDLDSRKLNQQVRYPLIHDDIINSMLTSNPMAHPSVMFRRSEVLNIGGYRLFKEWNGVSTEDYDLWLRIASNNFKLANLEESLLYYRYHSNSLTQVAFANGKMIDGFNNCFYISGPDVFKCSSEELKLLREKRHPLCIVLFIRIANHLNKNNGGNLIRRLRSNSFLLAMQTLTPEKDIISRLVIASLRGRLLVRRCLKSIFKNTFHRPV
jgi:glycosyltransferase involved in cell wall biosynthesis